MKYKWHEFRKLKNFNELADYLDGREYMHTGYFHYTNLKVIENILNHNYFWLSCVDEFNDEIDKNQFGDKTQQKEYYSLCFSTGVNENLSLWYLYSGIDGKGGRIRITKSTVRDLISHSNYYLCEFDDKNKTLIESTCIKLEQEKDFEVSFKDIIYYSEHDDEISLKYNTMTNYNFKTSSALKDEYRGFLKGLIWYYEKETRLIVHLKGEMLNKVRNDNKKYVVVLSFSDFIKKKISINFGPEVKDLGEILNCSKYPNINQKFLDSSKVKLSDYKGQIKMNLCSKCEHKKQNN